MPARAPRTARCTVNAGCAPLITGARALCPGANGSIERLVKTETVFDIGFQACSVRELSLEDLGAIQGLYQKCLDYMLLVDGRAADPDAVAEEFEFVPPGKSRADKFMFGITDEENNLVGLLDTLPGYPEEGTWWIATLLLVPEIRSQGLGQVVVQGLADYVRAKGGQAIMLGVVDENERAYKFWTRMGFEFVRRTEPQQFGNKTHTVTVMRRRL
jgi:ribosomal protein S18 acetylase RimI-like enzyme